MASAKDVIENQTSYVVAIDFGTTYSGFAVGENEKDTTIFVNPWPMTSRRKTDKIPTCILFDENQQFHSFGFESEDKYAKLQRDDKHETWYFFKHFKMKLKEEKDKLSKQKDDWELLDDTKTKKMKASLVFKGALEFIKKEAIDAIKKRYRFSPNIDIKNINESTISWLLTVPAIWTEVAKDFMRKCAIEAGIPEYNLTLVYEQEMAAVCCMVEKRGTLPPGTTFLVLDLGGGTIDITVQEVLKNYRMRQLHYAVGDACGATTVDQKLVNTIEKKYANNIDTFRKQDPQEYVRFLWDIESMKLDYSSTTEQEELEIEISQKLSKSATTQKVTISQKEFKGFLAPTLESIDRFIVDIQKLDKCKNVSHLILTGGFSNDTVIRDHIEEKYRTKYIIVAPVDPGVVVLKGAVLFGQHDSKKSPLITERVCKYTYGFAVFRNFDKSHKEEKKIIRGGKTQAKDCFKVVFRKGERVKVSSFREIHICDEFMNDRADKKKEPLIIKIYSSEEENPKYTDDTSCKNLCEMKMYPPKGELWPDRVNGKVRFEVAGTELQGTLYDNSNRKQDQCEFEYLI